MIDQDQAFRKVEDVGRLFVPHALMGFLLLLNIAALPIFPAGMMKPQLVLMAVYYWSIYRPTLFPPFLCFTIGLLMDSLGGLPLGINAFILVLTQWVVRDQRRFLMGQPYSTIWAIFGFVSMASVFIQWALGGLPGFHWGSLVPLFSATLVSMFLFPFVTLLLIVAHRILPVASRAYP